MSASALYDRILDENLDAVRRAQNGSRNATLNRSAFATAQLAKAGRLNAVEEKRRLLDAAKAAGLAESEARATIDSAWRAGEADPRSVGNDNTPGQPPRYPYHDAHGRVTYVKARVDLPGQKYQYQHFDGQRWRAGRNGAEPIPYRLPDLLNAPSDAMLFMAEGEKHADKLAGWGLLATSLKDWKRNFAPYVAGRTVIILPDNDDGGAVQAEKTARLVEKAGGIPHLVHLPGLPQTGDIMDWPGTADDLQALVDAALKPAEPSLLDLDDAASWDGIDVPARRWLVEDWLPIGEAALLTGAGSVGKSLIAQQLATTVAAGRPFMGVGTEQTISLYITCEDGTEEAQRRHKAIIAMLGTSVKRGQCMVKSWKGEIDLELVTFDADRRMRPTERFRRLRSTAIAIGARLIVLDNTSHLFGGDENVKREVAAFVNLLNGLAAEIDGVVLLLGHPNKTGLNNPGAGDANQFGGSVAWENQVRSRMFMATVAGDPDARELTNPKANYSGKGGRLGFRWHKGAFVRDEDLPENTRAEIAAVIASNGENESFLACLRERASQGDGRGVGPSPGSNYAPAQFEGMTQARGLKKPALKRAMDRLFAIGRIETYEHRNTEKARTVTLIREVENVPERSPERFPNTVPERPRPVTPNDPVHTPYTYGINGAATEAAAPYQKLERPAHWQPPSVAPGDEDDDPFKRNPLF